MTNDTRPAVLVVDDDTAVRGVLGAMLEHQGFAVREAASGTEGVETYARHAAEIDAVVLDVQMPEKDGPQTLAELRALDPDVPCVFVTGYSPNYTHGELADQGATVLSKPVTMAELGRAVRAATGRG
jgi:two-component system OmpR family response regulator